MRRFLLLVRYLPEWKMIEGKVDVGIEGERRFEEQHKMRERRSFYNFYADLSKFEMRGSGFIMHQASEHVSS